MAVKAQILKTAIEAACMILRVDDIVSGMSKKELVSASQGGHEGTKDMKDTTIKKWI